MTGNPDLVNRVAAIFETALHLDVSSPDTDLFETGALDSLAFVELLLQLECEFGMAAAVEDLDVDNFRTIERIAAFVGARTVVSPRVVPLRAGV